MEIINIFGMYNEVNRDIFGDTKFQVGFWPYCKKLFLFKN